MDRESITQKDIAVIAGVSQQSVSNNKLSFWGCIIVGILLIGVAAAGLIQIANSPSGADLADILSLAFLAFAICVIFLFAYRLKRE